MVNPSHSPGGTGTLFPDATLPTLDGKSVSLDSYRTRHDLVMLLLGEGELRPELAQLLDALAAGRRAVEDEDGVVLAVAPAERAPASADWRWPFPLLLDERGQLHARVGAVDGGGRPTPALFVTDRYREIYARLRPGEPGWPRTAKEVAEWLTFANIQCPECNVPESEW